ncbi:Two-component response regulator ARR-B family [Heracleum sosnowskyi]|uniref:Two-component response regulator ARR-B family n=1 Tax=Heracleum sosnowskyi TaxID=360622 RepID=A0AAD8HWW8_9APIA|nr:Two-component response regulator ARR-B family [Heracleum sosnowskyi]
MFSILVVDDDSTCLYLLKAYLEKWNIYEVTTAKHAQEALSLLRTRSYDLVLSDVHMPDINGLELLKQIDQEFYLPVILISADRSADVMCMGMKNGAQFFLVKPTEANDLQNIWQFSVWWNANKNKSTPIVTEINESSQGGVEMVHHHKSLKNNINAGALSSAAGEPTTVRRNTKVDWTPRLHSRFAEAILIIGYDKAIPTNILEVMNVSGINRGHIASHIQKCRKFLQDVLDEKTNIECKKWIDLNYYSSILSGNPDLLVLNQLREEQTKERLAANNPLLEVRVETREKCTRSSNTSNSIHDMIPSAMNIVAPSATFRSNFYSQPSVNVCGFNTDQQPDGDEDGRGC